MSETANDPASVPALPDLAALASAMGRTVKSLRWLAFTGEPARRDHYRYHSLPKGVDSHRDLMSPHRELAYAQEWILRVLLDSLPVQPEAHGYVRGRSVLTYAQPHEGRQVVLTMDLTDFFGHCQHMMVAKVMRQFSSHAGVITALTCLTTAPPRVQVETERGTRYAATEPASLPQGALTSPSLSNHCALSLDSSLTHHCGRWGYTYTRYSDDMAFSPNTETPQIPIVALPQLVRFLCGKWGFRVNGDKTKFHRRDKRQKLCGVVVNGKVSAPRSDKAKVRNFLHRLTRFVEAGEGKPPTWQEVDSMRGRISWLHMFEPEEAGEQMLTLHRLLARIDYKDIKRR
jgi:RNA-directed DNA polymerase